MLIVDLSYVYRSDDDGNVSLMDNLKAGANLVYEAENLIQGGFRLDHLGEAEQLFSGARDFFHSLKHRDEQQAGLAADRYKEDWSKENKFVTMFSGCRDDRKSKLHSFYQLLPFLRPVFNSIS